MNVVDTLRGLLRRWYVVVAGLILAILAGAGTYSVVEPGYERTSTQLLVPGEGLVPPGVTNPYLYLGGLTQAADLVVRVMKSSEVLGPVVEDYPGTEVLVQRDPLSSGPVIQIVVTAKTEDAAAGVVSAMVAETDTVLERLQDQQNVSTEDRMSVELLTMDKTSALQQKSRLITTAGVVLGMVLVTLVIASLVDGLIRRPRRARRRGDKVAKARAGRVGSRSAETELEELSGDDIRPARRGADEDMGVADIDASDIEDADIVAVDDIDVEEDVPAPREDDADVESDDEPVQPKSAARHRVPSRAQ